MQERPGEACLSVSQRSSYRARLIGSTASSSRSKSMQASLRPSASADVEPLSASSFCASIRLYATSDSSIPEGEARRQSCLSSPGVCASSEDVHRHRGSSARICAQSSISRRNAASLAARTADRARQHGVERRAYVRLTSSDKPAMVQPRALIVRVGPKSLPHKLELCVPDWGLVGRDPSISSARTRLRPTS